MFKSMLLPLIFISPIAGAMACDTMREIYIENDTTKVWKTTICPNQRLPFHSHQFARVVIPDHDAKLQVIYRSGKKETIKLTKQIPTFLSAEQGYESHQDVNLSSKPLRVLVIEIKKK